jgi:hypothetical protein
MTESLGMNCSGQNQQRLRRKSQEDLRRKEVSRIREVSG